jgi:hypothetical protein
VLKQQTIAINAQLEEKLALLEGECEYLFD